MCVRVCYITVGRITHTPNTQSQIPLYPSITPSSTHLQRQRVRGQGLDRRQRRRTEEGELGVGGGGARAVEEDELQSGLIILCWWLGGGGVVLVWVREGGRERLCVCVLRVC